MAINAAVLEDVGVLPDKTAGLLGLAFLESLGNLFSFIFVRMLVLLHNAFSCVCFFGISCRAEMC